ncbi:MAG TPA: hypothetical protein VE783_08430 [Candidatus Limnocylindrales bacterium]|jgi:hypothetical protein|nr:hypothetical protein [Candidatus Limnocylindrales bacterium]
MASLARAQENQPRANGVQVQMRNVTYHYADNIAVQIRRLGGELVPIKGDFPIFDDKHSFSLQVMAAEMAISAENMANVLNQYAFARKDSPIKDASVAIVNGRLKIKGKLHNKGDVSFETESTLSVTGEGKIRMHAEKVRALHLPAKGFMDLFGIEIADLIKTGKVNGISAEKDDLIFDPSQALPPPHISGKITEVRLEGNNIVQVFGSPSNYKWVQVPAQNYMAYHGNRLKFGKLTMEDTDLVLIDPDPRDPFDFYLDHYQEQLTAGYTKTTPQFGLRVYMVDYSKLKRVPRGRGSSAGKK